MTNKLTMLLDIVPPMVPAGAEVMTITNELPPGDPGAAPHRHSGPVFGYMLEGEILFDRESKFVAVMIGVPGEPMLTFVDADELEARRDRRGAPQGAGPGASAATDSAGTRS
ncbi:cupin [Kribbella sp. NPDC051718]|uniref:cupin n=1 Tax=Kribbella sp. NPDC051718 TaxID=3155168 RepID=UPI0034379543